MTLMKGKRVIVLYNYYVKEAWPGSRAYLFESSSHYKEGDFYSF